MIKGDFMMNDMKELPQEIKNIYNNQPYIAKRLRDEREKIQKQSKETGKRIGEKEFRKGNHPWGVGSFKGVPDNIFAEEVNIREIVDNNEEDKIIDYLKKFKKHKNKIVSHLDSEGVDHTDSSIGEYDTDDSWISDSDEKLTQEQLKFLRSDDKIKGFTNSERGKKIREFKTPFDIEEERKEKNKRKNSSPQTKKKKSKHNKGGRRTRRRRRKKRTRRRRKSRRKSKGRKRRRKNLKKRTKRRR